MQRSHVDLVAELRARVSPDSDLLNQAADVIEVLSVRVEARRAIHRAYMRKKRAEGRVQG
jgi:hypothetical protein